MKSFQFSLYLPHKPVFALHFFPATYSVIHQSLSSISSSVPVTQPCLTLYDPTDCHTPGFPVHHQLPEFIQTLVHWVSDATQPSHPLLSPSPFPASGSFPMSLSLHQVAKVLEFQLQHRTNIQDWFSLGWTGWISLQSKGLSRVFSNTTVQKHQFFSARLSL